MADLNRAPGFDPACHLCDIDRHVCPGCGANVQHGTVACAPCAADPVAEPQPVDLDSIAAAWVVALRGWDAEIARLQDLREQAVALLKDRIGDAPEGRVNGRPVVSWAYSKPAEYIDKKALEAAHPAIAATFTRLKKAARPFRLLDVEDDAK